MRQKRLTIYFILFLMMACSATVNAQLKVLFPSKDDIMITADWYPISSSLPVILLCHQEGSSRGEFIETALRLNKFGFNCLAIDLRVGKEINGIKNETAALAGSKKLNPSYADAEQDIIAAIDYLQTQYKQKVIILGSSYSAALALKIASANSRVKAAVVFSPEEYASDSNYIKNSIQTLAKPVFASSSRAESEKLTELLQDVNSRIKIQFVPRKNGEHGAKSLWSSSAENHEYWIALMSFLDKIKNLN